MKATHHKQLALLQAQLNAARMSAMETQKSVTNGAGPGEAILPFLNSCAKELEDTARLIRATADAAAAPSDQSCSG